MSDDDLSQRDLSEIADEDLSPEERRELERRLADFLGRLRGGIGVTSAEKPKRIARWNPAAVARKP